MKTLTQGMSLIGLLAALSITRLLAADHITFHAVPDWSPSGPERADAFFIASQRELEEGVLDPLAQTLMGAAESFTKGVFNLPTMHLRRAASYRNNLGDNLIAEWDFHEPFATGTIILRDTPYMSTYSLLLSDAAWRTPEGVSGILNALVRWSDSPIKVGGLLVNLPSSYPRSAAFWGSPPPPSSEVEFIRDFYIFGWAKDADLYLKINVGKSFTQPYYPVPSFIPERFPPLPELVRSWSDRKIMEEVGRPTDPSIHMDFGDRRDLILITELARRGLDQKGLVQLMTDVPPERLASRAGVVFQASKNAGRSEDLKPYLLLALEAYEHIGPTANDGVGEAFRILVRERSCDSQFEAAAVRFLQKGIFQEGALIYLGQCSSSTETMRVIETSPVPKKLERLKELTASGIRHRLASQP